MALVVGAAYSCVSGRCPVLIGACAAIQGRMNADSRPATCSKEVHNRIR